VNVSSVIVHRLSAAVLRGVVVDVLCHALHVLVGLLRRWFEWIVVWGLRLFFDFAFSQSPACFPAQDFCCMFFGLRFMDGLRFPVNLLQASDSATVSLRRLLLVFLFL